MKKSKQLYLIHHFDLCRMFLRMYVSHNPKTFYNIGLYHITQKFDLKTFLFAHTISPGLDLSQNLEGDEAQDEEDNLNPRQTR
jgi:hypothetical protein